jgi:hypothetical protein
MERVRSSDNGLSLMTSRPACLGFVLALSIVAPVGGAGALAQDHMPPAVAAAPQPGAHLVVGQPLAGPLSAGLVIITVKAENLKVVPVYGETASQVMPRLGHFHITVDDGPWHWLHASEEPIILQGLVPGSHRVLIELADANHKVLDSETRAFEIPQRPASH